MLEDLNESCPFDLSVGMTFLTLELHSSCFCFLFQYPLFPLPLFAFKPPRHGYLVFHC